MTSLITSNEEIQSILESCSYEEYDRLVPTLQEGMRRLQAEWEGSEKKETPYGVWLTGEVVRPGAKDLDTTFRIYTQKVAMVVSGQQSGSAPNVEYEVIASYCDDTYDDRCNYRDEGDMQVVILGRSAPQSQGEGHDESLYLITGSYHYLSRGCEWEDDFSVKGYPENGTLYTTVEGEPGPGLVFDSVVPFAEIVGQLQNRHPWYYTRDDMPQVYCVRSFKDALMTIAEAAQAQEPQATQEA
jgi:hypothetical protein